MSTAGTKLIYIRTKSQTFQAATQQKNNLSNQNFGQFIDYKNTKIYNVLTLQISGNNQ